MEQNAFSLLCKPIRRLLEERGFREPTEPQQRAIPLILEGKNVLLISPTATGKTEAAILPVLHLLLTSGERKPGIKILYITPLRALNRDMLDRLLWWCERLDVKVAVRHGDTATSERARQARSPPDMLITTPETLQAILCGRVMRSYLKSLRHVIVDEVHEIADNKRGCQLSLALERLREIIGHDFQVIGLSATIGTPEEVGQFLVGVGREVEIVKVPAARYMRFSILYPQPEERDYRIASKLYTRPEVAARLRVMRELIERHNSTLVFTNTRAISEVLTSRFRVWDSEFPVSIHHGSLSKPSRIAAERGLKSGELKSVVCTSSLELGIDVGRVDLVIQYMSPRQVTRLVQRVGRSGHRVGGVAKGVVITMDSDDTLEAMVICRRALAEELEPVVIPEKPYDVLINQIVALLIWRGRWYFHNILEIFRRAYPFRNLTEEDLLFVLRYMHDRFPRLAWVSEEDQVVLKPRRRVKDVYRYFFDNLSMIPDEKDYLVIDETTDTPVGILHEAFVAEYGQPGVKFICRGSPWIILNVYGDKIYVKPVDDPTGAIPSWVGEELPVPKEVAEEVGRIRGFVEERLKQGCSPLEVAEELSEKYPVDAETALRALSETVEHVEEGLPTPTDRRIVVEEWGDMVIVHSNFGSLVNRTIGRVLGYLISEDVGLTVGVQQDPYRIMLQTFGEAGAGYVARLLKELPNMDLEAIVRRAVERTGLFKRRLIHVARKAGALEKWANFSNVSMSKLISMFEGTAIYEEAVKDTFRKDLDVKGALEVVEGISRGEIEVVVLEPRGEPSPIARVGIERMSMKMDVIPPERMKRLLLESTKARVLGEFVHMVCVKCPRYLGMFRVKNLPDRPRCPSCGSTEVAPLKESEDVIASMVRKAGKGLSKAEGRVWRRAKRYAKLVSRYGKVAVVVLAGKGLGYEDAKWVLDMEDRVSDRLFELIMEAERRALRRRFW